MLESYQITELLTTMMIVCGVGLLAYSPLPRALGQAIAHRLMHGKSAGIAEGTTDPRVDAMADEVAMLRRQLEETQDRLDFTERMLAQAQQKSALGAGESGRDA